MSSPVISIVMAAFNEEKHINESIDSILKQTYSDFELIIINDGSTDKTEQIIKSFGDKRIVYVKNEKNLKLISSLNKGLELARGKYIARMDADDICYPKRLEKQLSFMEANPEVGISGAQLEIFGNSRGFMNYPLDHDSIKLRLLITSCFGNNVVIFRREIFEKYELYFPNGYIHAEDYKCWTNWIKHTKLANLEDALVRYRSHSASVSITGKRTQRETRDRIRKEYLTELFQLSEQPDIATLFYGTLSGKRINAIKFILDKNNELRVFPEEKLAEAINNLWYSDALEGVEDKFGNFLRFRFIFKLKFPGNGKRWINVLKHYIVIRFNKNK
jgi:glycosyltransferase involved in cell wall biosynthesis